MLTQQGQHLANLDVSTLKPTQLCNKASGFSLGEGGFKSVFALTTRAQFLQDSVNRQCSTGANTGNRYCKTSLEFAALNFRLLIRHTFRFERDFVAGLYPITPRPDKLSARCNAGERMPKMLELIQKQSCNSLAMVLCVAKLRL